MSNAKLSACNSFIIESQQTSSPSLEYLSSGEMDSDLEEQLLASVYYSKHFELEPEPIVAKAQPQIELLETNLDEEEDGEISKYTIQSSTKIPSNLQIDFSTSDEDGDDQIDLSAFSQLPSTLPQQQPYLQKHKICINEPESVPSPSKSFFLEVGSDQEDEEDEDESSPNASSTSLNSRYFLEGANPTCFSCLNLGHISRDCPTAGRNAVCFLCGKPGHARNECPMEMCYNCCKPGHTSRNCPFPRKRRAFEDDKCSVCAGYGHLSRECTVNWRRYTFDKHIEQANFVETFRRIRRFCYFCAGQGHFGDDCPLRRRYPASGGQQGKTIFQNPNWPWISVTIGWENSSQLNAKKNEASKKQSQGNALNQHGIVSVKPKIDSSFKAPVNALKRFAPAQSSLKTKPNLPKSSASCKENSL
jgi:hypothetical protein